MSIPLRRAAQLSHQNEFHHLVLPIYGTMLPWTEMALDDLKQNYPDCQWLFHTAGQHIKDFRKAWENTCEAADVDATLFHDLRRSAARNMEFAGAPRTVARAITGQKPNLSTCGIRSFPSRTFATPERSSRGTSQ
jgi:integrase